jgi:hypothetical protein
MIDELQALGARIELAAFRLRRGENVRPNDLTALADAAIAIGPSLDDQGRSWLSSRVGRMVEALDLACSDLDDRLRTLGPGRRAVRGYAAVAAFGR